MLLFTPPACLRVRSVCHVAAYGRDIIEARVLALPPGSTYSLSVFDGFQAFRGSTLPLVASTLSASSTAALSWASVA